MGKTDDCLHGKLQIQEQCCFQGLQEGNFPPKTITNFVCFLDVFHIFSPHKSNFPPETTFLENTLFRSYNRTLLPRGGHLELPNGDEARPTCFVGLITKQTRVAGKKKRKKKEKKSHMTNPTLGGRLTTIPYVKVLGRFILEQHPEFHNDDVIGKDNFIRPDLLLLEPGRSKFSHFKKK